MPTSFSLFFLGIAPEIDTVEGNNTSENHAALNGLSFGGPGTELSKNIQQLSDTPSNSYGSSGSTSAYDANNAASNETFSIDGGAPQTHDATMAYNNTLITYSDGTTATVNALVMQDTDGNLYLLPPTSGPSTYSDALEAKPIESITLGTAAPSGGSNVYGMTANRYDLDFAYDVPTPNYIVDGTAGSDLIDASYNDDPDGDRVDDNDNLAGNNDDKIDAGAGNDTVVAGDGNDTVLGGEGNDSISGGVGDDVIYGDASLAPPVFTVQYIDINGLTDNAESTSLDTYFDLTDGTIDVSSGDTAPSGATFQVNPFGTATTNDLDPEIQSQGTPTGIGYGDNAGHALVYSTQIDVQGGTYTFDADFYNSAALYIDGQQVFLSEGLGANTANGSVVLGPGTHDVVILYAKDDENATEQDLNMTISGGELGANPVPFQNAPIFGTTTTGAGNDIIDGGTGDDSIFGEGGDDTITGGTGSDTLFGDDGDDSFFLAQGDVADGGDGEDLFILTDLGEAGSSPITIDGGTTGEPGGDTLDLNGLADRSTLVYSASAGDSDAFDGTITMLDGTIVNFSNIENIICFTPGTMIATSNGERAVEALRPGDLVLTKDDGPQPLGWTGQSTVPGTSIHAPITLAADLTGARRPLTVSPQHRMLIADWRAELLFGDTEVFVPASHMLDFEGADVTPTARVTYIHLMLDRHHVIFADGAETESFHLAEEGLKALHPLAQKELFTAFPELRFDRANHDLTARRCLKLYESQTLLSRMFAAKKRENSIAA
ncbi:Hint domain-containing protein [Sulfitobacter sp. F26204]|uniref:Hint domain-containing protein n=1 Tax=Sulfitobacter sp. F26204 TaxID=2996014 RepID=UPI00225E453A|nr:Hint domain-containing protein [Sulfitobacter sp. F26204]MCX7560941.1 Hint domain-containing protein [Sulfitobacter sp. F26204]